MAPITTLDMSLKKKAAKSHSTRLKKKAAWRRIDHSEIEDTAALDVRNTLIKRVLRDGSRREEAKEEGNHQHSKKKRPCLDTDVKREDFFSFDASGTQRGLSRSTKQDITKRVKGENHLSEYQLRAVERTLQSIPIREQQLRREANQRSLITAPSDLWGSEIISPSSANVSNSNDGGGVSPKKRRRSPAILRAPAVKLPVEGQSVSPVPEQHTALVRAAVAVELDKESQRSELDRSIHPVTYALYDILPCSLVKALTPIEKQRVFAFYNSLKIKDSEEENSETQSSKVEEFLRNELGIEVEKFDDKDESINEALQRDQFLGLRIRNNVYVSDSETETESEEGEAADQHVVWQPAKNKTKTKADKNRFERHLGILKESASRTEHKKFLRSIERIKEYLAEIEGKEEQLKARARYRSAVADAVKEATLKGVNIKMKRGKHVFEETPSEVILPSAVAASSGCLRRTKFSQVVGAAIKDRTQSIYRRGLLEAAPRMTTAQLYRVQKQTHWKKRARKLIVKF